MTVRHFKAKKGQDLRNDPRVQAVVSGASAYLRDVGSKDDPCWVPCAKGDPGAVLFIPA